MSDYDSIIIGAGHNGLTCATLLAQAGQKVLVLEAADQPGGMAAAHEFHQGYNAPVAHGAAHFSEDVAKALNLEHSGLQWADGPIPMHALVPGGRVLTLCGESLEGASADDLDAWPDYYEQIKRFAQALAPFWLKTIPRLAPGSMADTLTYGQLGWNLKRLGKQEMGEFLRVFSLPMRDLVDEHFEDEALKALLAWDGLIGSRMAPRSPNNAVPVLLYRQSGRAVSSSANLVQALTTAAKAAGVTLRTGARVQSIEVEHGHEPQCARGVCLENGERIQAKRVVSSADPKTTFLKLLGARHLEIGFTNRIERLRSAGLVAKLHLALDKLPHIPGLKNPTGRMIIAPSLDAIELAFDPSKYGELPACPVLECALPSITDPALAPAGGHVLSVHILYVPCFPPGGWTDDLRRQLTDTVVELLEIKMPGLSESIQGLELLVPPDIAARHGVSGGHWHHAETGLDQMLMMRPTYEAAQYSTPLNGLYLCGAGCHPAGDLTGAAGHNAAREILR